ncbi:MAG TPA: dTDP-4-dehydrorhamnose 3,5-epimerase [Gemmataceae bacterium]|nr:dTDP-4-dehydrorhamnose 3,5-epimerase [Gemmataceae bacterium]
MIVTELGLSGLVLVKLEMHADDRGFFTERFHRERFAGCQLPVTFFQDNHSRSNPGVLRGLHYQNNPAQGKLVGVIRGRVWDVALDIRPESPTFGRWHGCELSDVNGHLLWIPPGFAHGFCVLGQECADLLYKVDAHYNPRGEGGVHWADPDLAIPWPIDKPIVSTRDNCLQAWKEYCRSLGLE